MNLRVTGIGPIARPGCASWRRRTAGRSGARTGVRPVFFDDWVDTPDLLPRRTSRAGDVVAGPAVIEEFGSTVPLHPGFAATVDRFGNLLRAGGTS